MEDQAKIELFENVPPSRAVMTMTIPAIVSSLVMVVYSIVDTYFVGMLGDPVQNAAVTLATPVLLAFNAVNNLFGVGSSSLMSRALGQKDYELVRRVSAFGFWCTLGSGVLFSVSYTLFRRPLLAVLGADPTTVGATAEYLRWTTTWGAAPAILGVVLAYLVRAEGASLHASIGTMSGCVLNILLDPVFILPWGLGMGAAGAGCATFLGNSFTCGYFLLLLFFKRRSTCLSLSPRMVRFSRPIVVGVCGVGIPAAIQSLLNVAGMTVLNNFTAPFGAGAVAAMGIARKIHMVPMDASKGFAQGIMPLISYNYGSGNRQRMRAVFFCALRVSMSIIVAVSAVSWLCSGELVSLFMKDPVIVAYGRQFLRGMSLGLPFLSMEFMALCVFQACGMGREALVFAVLRKIVLEIPALLLLNRFFPLYGLAYAEFITEVVMTLLAAVVLAKIFREPGPENSPER